MDERSALLYSKLSYFKTLIWKTQNFIKWSLKQVQNPYVACSFGKDSSVMLHLILLQKPDIKIRFIRWENETEHIDNYDEIISKWKNINLEQVVLSRTSLDDKRKERYDTENFDSYYIGLRKDESVGRRITLKTHGKFYKMKNGLIRISPLADWTTNEISAYIVANNIPLLNSYKTDGFETRTASRIPRADFGIRQNFFAKLKQNDIEAFNKLLNLFPDAKYYV